jgi:arylsulfatase
MSMFLRANGLLVLWLVVAQAAAAERPNIIVILTDDMGYSDLGCYGSEIETPNLDALAARGLRFTQFYNTGRCCPTRASLLTGLYPHQAGIGHMTEDSGTEAYRGHLNKRCVTMGEVLRSAGYGTYAVGKWHVTPPPTRKQFEDDTIDRSAWPLQRGFDRFYGTIMGAGSFFDPATLARDNELIVPDDFNSYYYTDAVGDHAANYIRQHDTEKPLFMYVAFTAAHWPMHCKPTDRAKYAGRYAGGWDRLRDERYAKMLELGVIDKTAKLSPHERPWKEVVHKDWFAHRMEAYAAMVDSMDQNVGKIVDALKAKGEFDNTLILYMQDNGGCQEEMGSRGEPQDVADDRPSAKPLGPRDLQFEMVPAFTRDGRRVRRGFRIEPGAADTYAAYGIEWANASNTPFRLFKHFVHEGGIATPLIAHWPRGISRAGQLEHQVGHLIDIHATCVDLAGADYPETFHSGQSIHPAEGVSLVPAFGGESLERNTPIFWEHEGNRAIRAGQWKLVARGKSGDWELYDMERDRSELNDLADQYPDKVTELAAEWQAWGQRAGIFPLVPY